MDCDRFKDRNSVLGNACINTQSHMMKTNSLMNDFVDDLNEADDIDGFEDDQDCVASDLAGTVSSSPEPEIQPSQPSPSIISVQQTTPSSTPLSCSANSASTNSPLHTIRHEKSTCSERNSIKSIFTLIMTFSISVSGFIFIERLSEAKPHILKNLSINALDAGIENTLIATFVKYGNLLLYSLQND
ncbi:hypothetical protein BpHYR1_049069 [Brachionus plicatilis]|uniref:Uncharacterized protein n=1 Tax=Brachionus plicatilis TaxID=10195 RepID=A0A3M7SPC7_BRAPC|nr:hypothetical protein BpHYR1_049069 [Brachionus plicatilis]